MNRSHHMIELICDFDSSDIRKKKKIVDRVQHLINDGVDLNAKDSEGNLPLCVLMGTFDFDKANQDMAMLLIKNGANVNVFDKEGFTPLMRAMEWWCRPRPQQQHWSKPDANLDENLEKKIRLLIECGASATLANNDGITAFHLAIQAASPQVLAILRKHVDREPLNVVEALLFLGHNSCMEMLEKGKKADNSHLEKTFEYAVRLRDVALVEYLAAKRLDIASSLNPLRIIIQSKSHEKTFDLGLLKFMAKFSSSNMELFWRHVLNIDYRLRARNIAEKWLTAILGEVRIGEILSERDDHRVKAYELIKSQTNEFINLLHDLFKNLRLHHIFAFDVERGGGVHPSYGWEVAGRMFTEEDSLDFGVENLSDLFYCYTDTKYYKDEARGCRSGRLVKPLTSVTIYCQSPTNKSKSKNMAQHVVETAKSMGFIAQLSGSVHPSITVSLEQ